MKTTTTIAAITLAAGLAHAQEWNEIDDAGQDGIGDAQTTDGSGPLTTINGTLATDVDLYAFIITDLDDFSASTDGGASFDTQLFLFDDEGLGVTENDDDITTGTLQSFLNGDGPIAAGLDAGVYYLAISGFNNDPLDSAGVDMFGFDTWPGRGDQRQPVSTLELVNWDGSAFGTGGSYTITLTGASFLTTCFVDFDRDGELTIFDFLGFQNAFDAGDLAADCDEDGELTLFDFLCFQNLFDVGCE
ncbi:MAG: DVUA0089 family protein [Planctomycetota bacterium]